MKPLVASLVILALCAAPLSLGAQRPGQPEIRIPTLERRMHDLVNAERVSRKLTSLQYDEKLSNIARAHSADMARRNFFDHINPDKQGPTARGQLAGYICRKDFGTHFTEGLAENLYQGNLYSSVISRGTKNSYVWNSLEEIARQGVTGWMKSQGHRENILEKTFEKAGIGIAISEDDKVYVTQMFC